RHRANIVRRDPNLPELLRGAIGIAVSEIAFLGHHPECATDQRTMPHRCDQEFAIRRPRWIDELPTYGDLRHLRSLPNSFEQGDGSQGLRAPAARLLAMRTPEPPQPLATIRYDRQRIATPSADERLTGDGPGDEYVRKYTRCTAPWGVAATAAA